ncbi:MAG: DNA translocase FtsK [Clostridia bacterium]|nr:DNA translocase FtsK [Clostridia bacterium]
MEEEKKKVEEKENRKESELVTKESVSAACALFSLVALIILFTRSLIFGEMGRIVHSFLTGIFGYCAYPLLLSGLYLSVMTLFGKRLIKNRKAGVCIALSVVFATLVAHVVQTTMIWDWSLDGYVKNCFYAGEKFPKATITGWTGGLLVYLATLLLSKIGALILFATVCAFFVYLTVITLKRQDSLKETKDTTETKKTENFEIPVVQPTEPAPMAAPKATTPYQEVQANQRPGVILPTDGASMKSNAYTPFAAPQENANRNSDWLAPSYEQSREFLFGSATPAENYKRNLIFDPNSKANQRPAAEPTLPRIDSGYTPSYSGAYADSVNEDEETMPLKIVKDNSGGGYGQYQTSQETENTYGQTAYESNSTPYVSPMQPIENVEPIQPMQPATPYVSPFETSTEFVNNNLSQEVTPPTEERFGDFNIGNDREKETIIESEEIKNETDSGYRRHEYMDLFSPSNPNLFSSERENTRFNDESLFGDRETESVEEESVSTRNSWELDARGERGRTDETPLIDRLVEEERSGARRDGLNLFDEDPYTVRSEFNETPPVLETRSIEPSAPLTPPVPSTPPVPPAQSKPRVIKPYKRISLDDFDCRDIEPTANEQEVEETKQNIIATLEDFKVTGASIASVTFGPTVMRYNVTIPRGISPGKVVALDQSIAISLHSSGVNVYPNYEDGVVSIEVPNKERQFVQLGCMLSGDTFVNAKSSSLMFAMGKDVANRKVYGDISKMIHLLVAGSSGSGKSVFLGALIISLIYKYSPEELRLILIDPKQTEFVLYNNLPHLMINEIITDVNKAVQSLEWAIKEMNRRYGLFEQMSRSGTYVVNLDQYNAQVEKKDKLPKIVVIIDELADLMLAAKKDIEDRIQNLTQKARAAGIHLVVATQRPSTDVITGVIKSNLATRIAFMVATDVDSRVILDQSGAQKLLGKGDFLYTMQGVNTPIRVQSAFISPEDSQRVVNFIKANNEAYYDEEATTFINNSKSAVKDDSGRGGDKGSIEPVYIEALRYVILSGSASISMIQRKCSAGYNKAGKIVEWMEEMGYISAFDGAKARKVLISKEEFESKYGPL